VPGSGRGVVLNLQLHNLLEKSNHHRGVLRSGCPDRISLLRFDLNISRMKIRNITNLGSLFDLVPKSVSYFLDHLSDCQMFTEM